MQIYRGRTYPGQHIDGILPGSEVVTVLTTVQASPGVTTSLNVLIGDDGFRDMAAVDAWLGTMDRRIITETERDQIVAGRQAASVATLPDPAEISRAAGGLLPNPKGYTVGDALVVDLLKKGNSISRPAANRMRTLFPDLQLDAYVSPGGGAAIGGAESSTSLVYLAAGGLLLWWLAKK